MATFRLWIDADNESFEGEKRNQETARILRIIAQRLAADEPFDFYQTIFDINGNDVGRAAFKEKGRE